MDVPSTFLIHARHTLERTPERLRSLIADTDVDMLTWKPAREVWSVEEVLTHLVQGEAVFVDRLHAILEGRDIKAFDQNSSVDEKMSWVVMPNQLVDQFSVERQQSLPEVESIQDDQLRLTVSHEELGPVTMHMLIADWAASDLAHTRQIIKLLVQPFYRELGPWQKYFKNSAFTE